MSESRQTRPRSAKIAASWAHETARSTSQSSAGSASTSTRTSSYAATRGADLHALRRRLRRQRRDRACATGPARRRSSRASGPTPRRVRARLPDRRGSGRAFPCCRRTPDDTTDVLRGLASRQLPDHLLPLPDCTGLAARAAGFRRGRGRRGAATSSPPAPVSRSHRAARRRSLRWRAPGHDDLRPRLATDAMGRADEYGELARTAAGDADIVIGNEEEVEAAAGSRALLELGVRHSCSSGASAALSSITRAAKSTCRAIPSRSSTGSAQVTRSSRPSSRACTPDCRSTRRYAVVRSPVRSSRRSWHARKRCRP